MEIKHVKAAIEAVLFASGEPIQIDRLAQTLETDKNTVQKIISIMTEEREAEEFGTNIIKIDDCYQLITKPEYSHNIRNAIDQKRNMPLSPAAMETLAIIAYNQPVTRGYIEQVRGVDSGGIVSSLESKGLVEERGRLDVPGRPILYGTTLNFLRCFGLKTLNDLPRVDVVDEPVLQAAELPVKSE
ncbi:MAG TPA: SMC-Scp complex subunit ScpB [Ruminiclostridium sp.]|nr:SMC-Scp complex subunit ScpB [Ruminiclostridium sp.]